MEEAAALFIGIAGFFVFLALAYLVFQVARTFQQDADKTEKATNIEICVMDKVAESKGIDTLKYALKNRIKEGKTFRQRLEEETIKEMFGEDKKDK